jgi:hypothetical protein
LATFRYPHLIQATSWQQLESNVQFCFIVALESMSPVLMGLWLLWIDEKRSVYVLLLSFGSVFLCAATWIFMRTVSLDSDGSIGFQGNPPPQCGGGIAPIKYCYPKNGERSMNLPRDWRGDFLLAGCLAIQACFIMDRLKLFRDATPREKVNCFD